MIADLADDVVTSDVVSPLRRDGKAAARERAKGWIASFNGLIAWENHDVIIAADGDVAFNHSLSHVTGKQKSGSTVDMWFRTTLAFRRRAIIGGSSTNTARRISTPKVDKRRSG